MQPKGIVWFKSAVRQYIHIISFLSAHSSLSFCVAQESLSLDCLPGQPPLSVKSLLNAYHHVDVSSPHDSQPAGVFWDTVTGPSFSPMLLHRGEGEKTTPVERQTSSNVCISTWDKNTVHFKQNPIFKNTVLFSVVYDWALSTYLENYEKFSWFCSQNKGIACAEPQKHIYTGKKNARTHRKSTLV